VTTYQRVEKMGTRTVQECRPMTETRQVTYTELVPYTTTEQVLVGAAGGATCVYGSEIGSYGGRGRGLFRSRCR
jgi:hypothetical protein